MLLLKQLDTIILIINKKLFHNKDLHILQLITRSMDIQTDDLHKMYN